MNNRTKEIAKPSAAVSSSSKAESKLLRLKFENELLINALHDSQEALEETNNRLALSSSTIHTLTEKLDRLYANFPNYWDAANIEHELIHDEPSIKIQWHVFETKLGSRHHSRVIFLTTCQDDLTTIEISNKSDGFDAFKVGIGLEKLELNPEAGPLRSKNNKTISDLGTTDWQSAKILINKIWRHLENSSLNLKEDAIKKTSDGLGKLHSRLESWPTVLRYDNARVVNQTTSELYQALDIEINNMQIGSRVFGKFHYRFSSVNEPGKEFGQFPRLEFLEDTTPFIENWFSESFDNRGRRLELRFAKPNQMDLAVWHKVSSHDQLLIAAIISKMPDILYGADSDDESIDLSSWESLSLCIKKILTDTLHMSTQRPSRSA